MLVSADTATVDIVRIEQLEGVARQQHEPQSRAPVLLTEPRRALLPRSLIERSRIRDEALLQSQVLPDRLQERGHNQVQGRHLAWESVASSEALGAEIRQVPDQTDLEPVQSFPGLSN